MLNCRQACGACCIAPSISSAIPGMPNGKPAGIRCIQLGDDNQCLIFDMPERPQVCINLRPTQSMCGNHREEAMAFLMSLELSTKPD